MSSEWPRIRQEILSAWSRGEAVTEMKIRTDHKNAIGPYLSVPTLQKYVQRIYKELDVRNATAAIAEGIRRGYLPCPRHDCGT